MTVKFSFLETKISTVEVRSSVEVSKHFLGRARR